MLDSAEFGYMRMCAEILYLVEVVAVEAVTLVAGISRLMVVRRLPSYFCCSDVLSKGATQSLHDVAAAAMQHLPGAAMWWIHISYFIPSLGPCDLSLKPCFFTSHFTSSFVHTLSSVRVPPCCGVVPDADRVESRCHQFAESTQCICTMMPHDRQCRAGGSYVCC